MDMLTESNILTQSKKAQEETNERLDALIAAQNRTNSLLEQLVAQTGAPPAQPDDSR